MMNFIEIAKDMIFYICTFLSDKDVINLFNTCSYFYKFTKMYTFNELHSYQEVFKKNYYESFTSIGQYKEGKLPNNIKKLCLIGTKEIKLNDLMSDNIEILVLDLLLTKSLEGNLPKNLKEFVMENVNINTSFIFPKTLIKMKLCVKNYLNLVNFFPESLQELHLEVCYKYSKMSFPKNLKKLTLNCLYLILSKSVELPPNLNYLDYNGPIIEPLPNTIISLTIYDCNINDNMLKFLPKELKNLYIFGMKSSYGWQIEVKYNNLIKKIPKSVDFIQMDNCYELFFKEILDDCKINGFVQINQSSLKHENSLNNIFFKRIND